MTAAIVIISCLAILAVSAQAIVRHRKEAGAAESPEISSGTAEAMLGVIGTLFSVLLGLLVAGAIDRYHDVWQNCESESNGINNIYRLSKGLEETDRKRIRGLCREYTEYVVNEEWPMMEHQQMSKNAQERYSRLWDACISVNPINERENNVHQAILEGMDQVGDDRRARGVVCMSPMPFTLWAVIICGSIITIAFTHLFTQHMGRFHWMMTALVAISLGLNIWLLAAYSTPFAGDLAIRPQGFELSLRATMSDHDDSAARYLAPSEQKSLYAKQQTR
jgi:hypothetical protein